MQPSILTVIDQFAIPLPYCLGIHYFFPWMNSPFLAPFRMLSILQGAVQMPLSPWRLHMLHIGHTSLSWGCEPQPAVCTTRLTWNAYSWLLCILLYQIISLLDTYSFKDKVSFLYLCILLKAKCYAWHLRSSSEIFKAVKIILLKPVPIMHLHTNNCAKAKILWSATNLH